MNTFMYPDLFYPQSSARNTSTSSIIRFSALDSNKKLANRATKPLTSSEVQKLSISLLKQDANSKDLFWVSARERTKFLNSKLRQSESCLPKVDKKQSSTSTESLSKVNIKSSSVVNDSTASTAAVLVDLNRQSLESLTPVAYDSNKNRYLHKYLLNKRSNQNSFSPNLILSKSNSSVNNNQSNNLTDTNRISIITPSSPLSLISSNSSDYVDKKSVYSNPIDKIEGSKMHIEEIKNHMPKSKESYQKNSMYKLREEENNANQDSRSDDSFRTQFRLKPLSQNASSSSKSDMEYSSSNSKNQNVKKVEHFNKAYRSNATNSHSEDAKTKANAKNNTNSLEFFKDARNSKF